jgi:hypothetical protein
MALLKFLSWRAKRSLKVCIAPILRALIIVIAFQPLQILVRRKEKLGGFYGTG